jgi:hypothetical protein
MALNGDVASAPSVLPCQSTAGKRAIRRKLLPEISLRELSLSYDISPASQQL